MMFTMPASRDIVQDLVLYAYIGGSFFFWFFPFQFTWKILLISFEGVILFLVRPVLWIHENLQCFSASFGSFTSVGGTGNYSAGDFLGASI